MMREVVREARACSGMGEEDDTTQKWAGYLAEDEEALAERLQAQAQLGGS